MDLKLHYRTLLRGITAGAVLLAGAAGCSRDKSSNAGSSDQAQTGSATVTDTQPLATRPTTGNQPGVANTTSISQDSTKPSPSTRAARAPEPGRNETGVAGYRAMGRDTSADTGSVSSDTAAVGDSAHVGKTGNRLEPTQASEQANSDTLSSQSDSVRIRPPEDSSETVGVTTTDTTATGAAVSPEMARDTTTALGQADTTAPSDTTAQVTGDTAAVQARVDTTQETEMAQEAPVDSTAMQARVDTTEAQADTSGAAQPTEMAHPDTAVAADTSRMAVADSSEINAQRPSEKVESDQAAVGAAGVGVGNIATGAEAVALMTRQGQPCSVVADPGERRDLASSPVTLNPCGTGTMTLPRVQTK